MEHVEENAGRRNPLALQLCEEAAAAADGLEEEPEDAESQDGEVIDESESVRRRPHRRRPAKDLPRDVIHHELPAEERKCSECGEEMPG